VGDKRDRESNKGYGGDDGGIRDIRMIRGIQERYKEDGKSRCGFGNYCYYFYQVKEDTLFACDARNP
jgi:hypothetical protein